MKSDSAHIIIDAPSTEKAPDDKGARARSLWNSAGAGHHSELNTPLLDGESSSSAEAQPHHVSLKALSMSINALMHPPGRVFRGGEGVQRIVSARDFQANGLVDSKYWGTTLFSIAGRAMPWFQWSTYLLYCVAVVVPAVLFHPDLNELVLLKALQFPVSVLGTALFLLMSFRTNSCYDRWWEGRKLWASMAARCQNTARLAEAWLAPDCPDVAAEIVRLTIATLLVWRQWLRRESHDLQELQHILPAPAVQKLQQSSNPLLLVMKMMTGTFRKAPAVINGAMLGAFDRQLEGFISDANGCNRIVNTPMPFAYIVHLRSFMVIWLLALPIVFLPTIGYWAIAVCAVVAYQLLGFEDIGVEIEQPFGTDYNDLPVDLMAAELCNELLLSLAAIEEMKAEVLV